MIVEDQEWEAGSGQSFSDSNPDLDQGSDMDSTFGLITGITLRQLDNLISSKQKKCVLTFNRDSLMFYLLTAVDKSWQLPLMMDYS
jgi:hypothetical protein